MFKFEKGIVVISTVLAIVIIGSILEGYILHEQLVMTMDNWQTVIVGRFVLHLIGILPLWILCGFLMESVWKAVVLCLINLTLMNINPIYDLVEGPIVIVNSKPEEWVREVYNNPSSDIDFSTREEPMIRLTQNGRSIMLPEDRWKDVLENCDGKMPARFVGLENLEVVLELTCP